MVKLSIIAALTLICLSVHAQRSTSDRQHCEEQWLEVSKVHKKKFFEENFEGKVRCYTVTAGQKSDPLTFSLQKGNNNRFVQCEYMRAWIDTLHLIVVLEESKTILLRNNKLQGVIAGWGDSPEGVLDSARHFITDMTSECVESQCTLTIRYQADHSGNTERISEAKMVYQKSTRELQSLHIVAYRDGKRIENVTEFLEYKKRRSFEPFEGSVINAVAENGHLKKDFTGYQFLDLRNAGGSVN